jgi:integrase/recombinase XerD
MKRVHLKGAVARYLTLRRALGFKLQNENALLQSFLTFLEAHGTAVITAELALRWAQQPSGGTPCNWAKRLGTIRCFAKYHCAFDPRTEVPPPRLIPPCARHRRPHIYTDGQIALLMREGRGIRSAMLAESYATLIGLLAVTGMRVGEAIALNDQDVDWCRSLLTVRHAKFHKSRLVPLHESTLALAGERLERSWEVRP